MQKIISAITSIILSSSALATECPKPVQYLLENEKANCTGFLFSPAKEAEIRMKNEDYKLLLEQSKLHIQKIEALRAEIVVTDQIVEKEKHKAELWRITAEKTTESYVKLQERQTLRDYGFLLSGIALTALAGWSLGQINN